MGILQPLFLWGALAISIPILIHLWHRRRGKKIQWAAMRWLIDKEDQPKKGLKPDHLLLLCLRILIILLVVFFLSQPFLSRLTDDTTIVKIHLVEPNATLVDEFRFELEQALSGGEELYWLDRELVPIASLGEVTQMESGNDRSLMEALNQIVQPHHELHLYISPHNIYMEPPFYLTPVQPVLHLGEYIATPLPNKYMEAADSEYLFINQQGMLQKSPNSPNSKQAIDQSGPISYLMDLENDEEIKNINSALQAIEEVYGLGFEDVNDNADIYFGSQIPADIPSDQLIIISNNIGYAAQKNVFIEPERFTKDDSEIVASGRLPEYILEKVLTHLELTTDTRKVSRQQLEQQFILDPVSDTTQTGNLKEIILLLLMMSVIGERFIALRKGL